MDLGFDLLKNGEQLVAQVMLLIQGFFVHVILFDNPWLESLLLTSFAQVVPFEHFEVLELLLLKEHLLMHLDLLFLFILLFSNNLVHSLPSQVFLEGLDVLFLSSEVAESFVLRIQEVSGLAEEVKSLFDLHQGVHKVGAIIV